VASQQSSNNLVSDRYASALYELSSNAKSVEKVLNDLDLLNHYIKQSKDFKLLLKSPLISSNEKLKIIEKILNNKDSNILTLNFVKVISKNRRFTNLPFIISRFKNINAEKRGEILADITSADKLSDNQEKEITQQLKKILGEKLILNFKIDKKIIGGLIIKVGSKMIDSSLVSKINKLKLAMKGA
jgi:ATP synthase, F1 delta subunit